MNLIWNLVCSFETLENGSEVEWRKCTRELNSRKQEWWKEIPKKVESENFGVMHFPRKREGEKKEKQSAKREKKKNLNWLSSSVFVRVINTRLYDWNYEEHSSDCNLVYRSFFLILERAFKGIRSFAGCVLFYFLPFFFKIPGSTRLMISGRLIDGRLLPSWAPLGKLTQLSG